MVKIGGLPENLQSYYTRLGDRLNSGAILEDLPAWICKNTRLAGEPWSFKDHEFQIAIVKDQSPIIDVKKCSQVGLSEVQARKALGMASIKTALTIIYVMPHNRLAAVFAKSRVDPIIEGSQTLKEQMRSGSDSSFMKQIGSSFIHFGGAESERSAISIPAQVLMTDEYDFCKMSVLGKYSSRLRHAGADAMRQNFSTPTVSNYGIALNVSLSDGMRYMVSCLHCGHTQAPSFRDDIYIPGFDKDFINIDKDDFKNDAYKFEEAYLKCRKCGKELESALRLPERREWVAEFPSRSRRGYSVKPFDLIAHNATTNIIQQRLGYENDADYWNFVQGEELDTDQNKVNQFVVSSCITGDMQQSGSGWYIGIDVGKICHIMIGRKAGNRRIVCYIGKIRLQDGDLLTQAIEIMNRFGFSRTVIDAGPDISLPSGLQQKFGHTFVNPCVYVRPKAKELSWFDFDEDTGVVTASRTKALDNYVATLNKGLWQFPRCDLAKKEMIEHMKQMVRVEQVDEHGDKTATWETATTSNHFFHAGFYLHCAMEMDESDANQSLIGLPLGITSARIGGNREITTNKGFRASSDANSAEISALAGMLGRMRR